MAIQQLTRVFRAGSIQLPDPDSSLSPEAVRAAYEASYPHLAQAMVEGPEQEAGQLIYRFVPPPAKTKG